MRDPRVTKRAAVEPVLPEAESEGEGTDDTEAKEAVKSVIHESAGRDDMMLWVEQKTKERHHEEHVQTKRRKKKVRLTSVVYIREDAPGNTHHHQTPANSHPLSFLLVSWLATSYKFQANSTPAAGQAFPTFYKFSLLCKTAAAVFVAH